jgi:UDP-N-acetylglucosamine 1-carboxyvinyltransferase
MEILQVEGGVPLTGTVTVSGSKNATLPVMAAALLTDKPVDIFNVPEIDDVSLMASMLQHLGAKVEHLGADHWRIEAANLSTSEVGSDLTQKIRGSFLLLGALVARTGLAKIAKPGGDDIGMRRVEQHLEGLRLMGAEVSEDEGFFTARATKLQGARIDLDMPTVTGTENLMMAASLADGISVIGNAAREPHVVDLARCLIGMGVRMTGAGTEQIVVEGHGGLLHGTQHSVTTDYIEAGTYMIMGAVTSGDVTVQSIRPSDLRWLSTKLRMAGCDVTEGTDWIRVRRTDELKAVDVTTWPHPGFATDLQSQFVALMTQAKGISIISEAVFENRFRHVEELRKLGANIKVDGRSAIVRGPAALKGTHVSIPDIRSGAALLIAGLCATGVTECEGVYHLDRGYEDLDGKMRSLGAKVGRVQVAETEAARNMSGVVGD